MYKHHFEKVKNAARFLSRIKAEEVTDILDNLSKALRQSAQDILEANKKDLARMDVSDPKFDRLKLTEKRINAIADDLVNVANLPCPVGEVMESKKLDNGLLLEKKRVALGVVGVIYEARPNVTIDVFALCLRSGNACVLKGGRDAEFSNRVLVQIIHEVLKKHEINPEILQLLPVEREATDALMNAVGYVDVLIPRGSQGLINAVRENAKLPVIETGAGIVHTYIDDSADGKVAQKVVYNAKTRRVSVCNALDCIIIHRHRLSDLPTLVTDMANKNVEIFADESAYEALKGSYPEGLLNKASEQDFGIEFLAYKLSVKTVDNFEKALDHIYAYSSKHSEAIIANDESVIQRFLNEVDSAAVYVNASTAFTDGAQFGLGAEIGISTQKLHARGPMGLRELTSYKWIIKGKGHIRPA